MNSETGAFTQVYNNLFNYFTYREVTPVSKPLTSKELNEVVVNSTYVDIITTPIRERDTILLYRLLTSKATQEHRKKDKLLAAVRDIAKKPELKGKTYGIVFIVWNNDKRTKDILSPFKRLQENAKNSSSNLPEITVYSYERFIINLFECILVPKQTLATQDEIRRLRIDPKTMRKIRLRDPACIWIGARRKDVIRVDRPSETAGGSIAYLECI
tara:strand:+ start:1211 stop:1852 length:642 start_codon:yes stop_codon:yes gene_type:complete